jgi:hypothetical protein
MSRFWKVTVLALEDLLGVALLLVAGVGFITTIQPSPEAQGGLVSGLIASTLLAVAALLFLTAARQLHRTGAFNKRLHAAPLIVLAVVLALGFLRAHL